MVRAIKPYNFFLKIFGLVQDEETDEWKIRKNDKLERLLREKERKKTY